MNRIFSGPSGSMAGPERDTIGCFNAMIKKQTTPTV